ncbi:hypothetical protein EZV62_011199 [Acer yangbiense]|uniref:DUF4283 domain-containing protein n=1 Tax=Acer yangbiense TaxID=1000413 RepID=A0A5C7I4Z5_9ROSI|nr:hypothetical protein EZV62_011199 [Acer yangbiense]
MATEEIMKLCETLSLIKEDGVFVNIARDVHDEGVESVSHCLVGKVQSRKKINIEAFRNTIGQIWGTMGLMEIEVLAEHLFVFHFQSLEDHEMVWTRGPWHFDRCLIVLIKPQELGEISKLSFNLIEFWVQVHNIPFICMNGKIAHFIINSIGHVIDFPMESKDCWGKFLRAKIRVDILSLLREECVDDEGHKKIMSGLQPKYGAWLQASSMDRVKPSTKEDGSNRDIRDTSKGFETWDQSYSRDLQLRKNSDIPTNQEWLPKYNMPVTDNSLQGNDVSGKVMNDQGNVLEQNHILNMIGSKDGNMIAQVEEMDDVSAIMDMGQTACKNELGLSKGNGRKWKRIARGEQIKQIPHGCLSLMQKVLAVSQAASKFPVSKLSPGKVRASPDKASGSPSGTEKFAC